MWLSLNAAHKPVHAPPDHLHTQDVAPNGSEPPRYRACDPSGYSPPA
jgi:hypothetical protein